ncbi:penicillin-binding protein 2 [Comamonas sp. BIGb0124]|uniref:penicillin-binding protein 2 n=1 Tax=Comamonas sp. BIGb0124 TaxID=2485130 RepID=UPI000F49E552|nr:penicillin-binding protein 2 [Comamonas sp. BIGb0124]ROR20732.1 penicillin-binding protein 2 [Comamonas sp. BIGb0124]
MAELKNVEADLTRFRRRVWVAALVVILGFSLLVGRLVVLQVSRHDALDARAERNRTSLLPIVPNRGRILDRNGVVLASSYSAYALEVTPSNVPNLDETLSELGKLVALTPRDLRRFRQLRAESRSFASLPLKTRLTDEEVARVAAQNYRFPGVEIKARLFRTYPYGELGGHVIGYIGRINEAEKERIEDSDDAGNYRGTESIGKLGIEQSYERQLHGTTGIEQVETSASGRAVRTLSTTPAVSGDDVMLSLDIRLQKLVEDLFGDRRGALVAIDPRTGEVLAMVSKPSFDPNLFVDGIDVESWKELNESVDRPLLNRALRGTYPPGSTYKPFMALAALETGKRGASMVVNDTGSWTFGGHTFRSHEAAGSVDMRRAIQRSSNVYFYSLANDMGVDTIHDFMKPLGFGQITGLDLGGEVRGVLPSTEWKRNTYRRPEQKRWYAGETISLGIGQGYNNFTMLQLANAMAAVANHGLQNKPHLVKAVRGPHAQAPEAVVLETPVNLGYKQQNIQVVLDGMVSVVTDGTGRGVFAGAGYTSGGKTGTAQAVTIGQKDRYDAKRLAERQRDHGLYLAFAPAQNPQLVVAAIVENAGWGAQVAAPIVRRVFDYALLGQYPSEQDIAAVRQGRGGPPLGTPRAAADIPLVPIASGD